MQPKNNQHFLITAIASFSFFFQVQAQGSYLAGDFHQHTTYTDGGYSFGHMMRKNAQFGLD